MATENRIEPPELAGHKEQLGVEVQDIISSKPPAWVRRGTTYILLILLFAGITTWLIEYPDIVSANGELIALNAPHKIRARIAGRLVKLFVQEGCEIKEGEPVGYMESAGSYDDISMLSAYIDSMVLLLRYGHANELINFSPFKYTNLGELRGDFETFKRRHYSFIAYLGSGFYLKKIGMLQKDISFINKKLLDFQTQKKFLLQNSILDDSATNRYLSLKNKKLKSPLDYSIRKSNLITKQMRLSQLNNSIISHETQLQVKRKEIEALDNEISQQKDLFLQTVYALKDHVQEWKRQYVLLSTVSGKVSFATLVQENQEIFQNQIVCYVVPPNNDSYAVITIPQYKFGKVQVGQNVKLRFPAYPYNEFGAITGILEFIASVPSDSGYTAKVILPQGLKTDFGKRGHFVNGLKLQAEIITEKKMMLNRLFDNLRSK